MRAGRLLSTLLLLQSRGRMTARELAAALEVSVRTVYRDVESLSAAGVPVYADRGPAGGYQLLGGYHTRLTGFTGDEADTLFLAGLPGAAAELGLGAELAAAQVKLEAALEPGLRERAGRIRERFHLDAPAWFREPDQVPHLAAVAEAVWNSRRITVRYRGWGSRPHESVRTLNPLGLIWKAGVWYLAATPNPPPTNGPPTGRAASEAPPTGGAASEGAVADAAAACGPVAGGAGPEGAVSVGAAAGGPVAGGAGIGGAVTSGAPTGGAVVGDAVAGGVGNDGGACGGVRTYRVARIVELTGGEGFERPERFDLVAFWREWADRFEAGVYREEMVLRLSPTGFGLLHAVWSIVAQRAAERTAGEPDEHGWREAVIPIESERHALVEVLKLGAEAEVLAPATLRAQVAATAQALATRYGSPAPPPN